MFRYHYENSVYGDLYLKNNRIDAKYGGIIYDEDEIPYKLPLNMVFNSVMVKKGQYVSICRLEDEDGNLFDNCADLELTLINQYNKVTKLSLKYDFDFAGYYLDTSSLDYGTYTISGSLSTKNLNLTKCRLVDVIKGLKSIAFFTKYLIISSIMISSPLTQKKYTTN